MKNNFHLFLVFSAIFALVSSQLNSVLNNLRRTFSLSELSRAAKTNLQESYDFVIIGAGSGGSVVANRLTENPKWSVLLIEAGDEEDFFSDIPLLAPLQSSTGHCWKFKSDKLSTACLGLSDQRCNLPRGKALGGTSVVNYLLYTRGSKHDYDEWAKLGNSGWSYDDVLPYFIKSENCTKCYTIDKKYHGTNGYLSVENPSYESPTVQSFLEAAKLFGYNTVDINAPTILGFSKVLATMRNGRRCSAAKAFLEPISHRRNLHIMVNSQATRIMIDPKTKMTYGVELLKNGRKFRVRANREVILSAGSYNSPQLLMLSGVGPKDMLQQFQIPVIQDLKVGYNLQDHLAMSTLVFFVNQSFTLSDRSVQNPRDIFNYLFNGQGPYTLPGGTEAVAFLQTKLAKTKNYPDIELVLGSGALNGDTLRSMSNLLGIPQSFYKKVYAPFIGRPAFSIVPVIMRPTSRGRIMLKSADPLEHPRILPNYLETEEDVAVMVEGIKLAILISQSEPFQKFKTTLNNVSFPGCEDVPFGTDPYWACAVRHVATSLGHQVGTCKMGPESDPDAVVDPELKVHGIKGLRVVDGSIMPNVVAGHTNAVIMMIGEKASDMIKKHWQY